MTAVPVRWLGRVTYSAIPIAIFNVDSGTARTRRRVAKCSQVYPQHGPADWLRDGHATAGITCIACRQHSADVRLETLPALTWRQIGPRMICEGCGAVGAVHIVPNWHDRPWRPLG
jgi:hypothetical protein